MVTQIKQCKLYCCRHLAPASHYNLRRAWSWCPKTCRVVSAENTYVTLIAAAYSSPGDDSEKAKFVQRLEATSRHFKRLGSFGFLGQLVCTLVAAVIIAFPYVVTGKITSPATFHATTGGIAAALISVIWSFGYIRLSNKLKSTVSDPSKLLCLNYYYGEKVNRGRVGGLVTKALRTSANPYYQGTSSNPVLALDIFLVQASANTVLYHFLGLICSLELLRLVTSPERVPIPEIA